MTRILFMKGQTTNHFILSHALAATSALLHPYIHGKSNLDVFGKRFCQLWTLNST